MVLSKAAEFLSRYWKGALAGAAYSVVASVAFMITLGLATGPGPGPLGLAGGLMVTVLTLPQVILFGIFYVLLVGPVFAAFGAEPFGNAPAALALLATLAVWALVGALANWAFATTARPAPKKRR